METRDYYFQPTDEILIEPLIQINNGEVLEPDRFERRDLFFSHPSLVIDYYNYVSESYPCLTDDTGDDYYLFYCQVPDGTSYADENGYHRIRDRTAMGVWEDMGGCSSVVPCDISGRRVSGEMQTFRYMLVDETATDWRMVMYGLPRGDKSNMVICKVFETEEAVRSAADMERDFEVLKAAHAARIELLKASLQEEKAKLDQCRATELVTSELYAEKVRARKMVKRKNADAIIQATS